MRVPEEEEDIFTDRDLINDRYEVVKRLGKGGYGEIYQARDVTNGQLVAVKVERVTKPGNLLEEEKILRSLNERGAHYVPRLISSGRHNDMVNFIVMELLGENLSVLRRRQPTHKFSKLTTMALGLQMLRAIKEVHDLGYIHRDIKPGNFVMGSAATDTERTVMLIDFGLSRRHFRPEGGVRPKRKCARWVGSRRYMSINTHQRKDQGRRDDLWSLLYVFIEFYTATLPWAHLRGIQNLDNVRDMKIQYNNEKLVKNCPEEFLKFMNHIKELRYEDRPDYDYLMNLLSKLFDDDGGDESFKFDWEQPEPRKDEDSMDYDPGRRPEVRTGGKDSGSIEEKDKRRTLHPSGNERVLTNKLPEDSDPRNRKKKKRKGWKKKCTIM